MTIVMMVLKVIGVILLILLGLLLLTLCMILFLPIRYRFEGTVEDGKLHARGKIRWIFRIVGADLAIDETKICAYGRVFWIKRQLYPSKEDRGQEADAGTPDNEPEDFETPDNEMTDFETQDKETAGSETQDKETADFETQDKEAEDFGIPDQESADFDVKRKRTKRRRKTFGEKIEGIREKGKRLIRSFKEKGKDADQTRKKLIRVWEDEQNQLAWMHIKRELFLLLKFLCPKRLKLDMTFSAGAPDKTGQLLGILSLFSVGYRNGWHVTPDFNAEKAYAEGNFDLKGHLRLCHLAAILIRVMMDARIRRLYRMIRKYFM